MRSILDEVVGPHMVAMFRSEPDARSICEPKTAVFRLFVGYLQPLTPPDAFHPLVVQKPARISQQRGDLAIAVAAVLTGQFDDIGGQTLFVVSPRRRLPLCRAMLAERRTSATLGNVKLTSNMLDTKSSARGA
jgi:hypothetical protein